MYNQFQLIDQVTLCISSLQSCLQNVTDLLGETGNWHMTYKLSLSFWVVFSLVCHTWMLFVCVSTRLVLVELCCLQHKVGAKSLGMFLFEQCESAKGFLRVCRTSQCSSLVLFLLGISLSHPFLVLSCFFHIYLLILGFWLGCEIVEHVL